MNVERLGRIARVLRVRERLTQESLAERAGVTRRAISALERGHALTLRLGVLDAVFRALGARLDVRPFWNGPELDRLLDAAHAALGASVKQRLERWGWVVRVEQFGWDVRAVVPAIVFLDDRTIRNRVARVDALFDRFSLRGRAATSWMRTPGTLPSGLLWYTAGPPAVPSRSPAPRVRRPRAA